MKYKFTINTFSKPNGSSYTTPATIFLEDFPNQDKFQSDFNMIDDVSYLDQIITGLHNLIDLSSVEPYEWGREIYTIVCDAQFCKCHDNFETTPTYFPEAELVFPTNEILQLLLEWREFVIQWRINYLGQDPALFK